MSDSDFQPEEVERVLGTCGSHVNEERQLAEQAVMVLIKKKVCVPLLVAQLQHSQHVGVRQLASILLRKKILGHWRKLDINVRQEIKGTLLNCAATEPVRVVKLGIAHCVAMLAKAEVASGTWPELFEFLKTQSQSPEVLNREMAIILLHACSQTILAQLSSQSGHISQFLLQGLQDPEQRVRVQTLRAACALITEIDIDVSVISKLLPAIFTVMKDSLHTQDEDLFTTAFELLEEILETPSFKGKGDTILKIVEFCISIITTTTNLLYREKAADILGKICVYKPKLVVKHNVVQPILQTALQLLADPNCSNSSLEPEEDRLSQVGIASQLIDTVAGALPSVQMKQLIHHINEELVGKKNPDPFVKKSCILALGSISHGCRDLLRDSIEAVVDVMKTCISDPNPIVREAALVAASQVTDYLQPEILDYHEDLLPLGIELLSDPSPYVREKASYMVDAYTENLEDDVLPYADVLVGKLLQVIAEECGLEGMKARCVSVQALSSVAVAIRDKFAKYADQCFKLLLPALKLTDDEMVTYRARCTDCIGSIANSVGNGCFDAYFVASMQDAAAGLALESSELSEFTFGFWSNMAELYPKEMSGALHDIIPCIASCINVAEGEQTNISPFGQLQSTNGIADEADSSDESDDEAPDADDMDEFMLRVDQKLLMARASALHCLAVLAKVGDERFEQYFAPSRTAALEKISHHSPVVKKNAIELLCNVTLWEFKKNYVEKVIGTPDSDTLATSTREILQDTLFTFLTVMREDGDKDVVAGACDCVGEICDEIGSVAVHNHIDAFMVEADNILACRTVSQKVYHDEDEDEDDLPEDHDQLLIDGACEMIEKIAKAYGPSFLPMFEKLLPGFIRYLAPNRPHTDHYMALAAFGEIVPALQGNLGDLANNLIEVCVVTLKSPDSRVRSNSSFTVGVLCEAGGESATPLYSEVIPILGSIITKEGELGQAVDNAVSAMCRMYKTHLASCHVAQTLPVLLQHIPLQSDHAEDLNVYSTLLWLLNTALDACKPLLAHFMMGFAKAISLETTTDEIKV